MPIYRDWNEAGALDWWRRFDAHRDADRAARNLRHSGLTMSVDTSTRL